MRWGWRGGFWYDTFLGGRRLTRDWHTTPAPCAPGEKVPESCGQRPGAPRAPFPKSTFHLEAVKWALEMVPKVLPCPTATLP